MDTSTTPEAGGHGGRDSLKHRPDDIATVTDAAEQRQLDHARAVTYLATREYWNALLIQQGADAHQLPLRRIPPGVAGRTAANQDTEEAIRTGTASAGTTPEEAGHRITSLYTSLMPGRARAELGAYYTPPAVARRMIELSDLAGVEWRSARVMDPACGGGAFLAPIAARMLESMDSKDPKDSLTDLESRLSGYEIDPFAAWMTRVFLDAVLMNLSLRAGRRPGNIVTVCDALRAPAEDPLFDLVIGKPALRQDGPGTRHAPEVPAQPSWTRQPLRPVHRPGPAAGTSGWHRHIRPANQFHIGGILQVPPPTPGRPSAPANHGVHRRQERRIPRRPPGNRHDGVPDELHRGNGERPG